MKRISYEGNNGHDGEVVYQLFGDDCVFSGISGHTATSTINAVEAIIEAIAKGEKIHPRMLNFFDLQTHNGYTKKLGELEYDHIKFSTKKGGKVVDPGWSMAELPEAVKNAFRDYIY